MKDFSEPWRINQIWGIFWILIIAIAVCGFLYWNAEQSTKVAPLLGGLITGLVLVLIQFLFSWREYKERENFELLGLKHVLKHKRKREYYGDLIKGAKKRIFLMGNTGMHFLEDFANRTGGHDEADFLLQALGKKVEVRFLLPNPEILGEDKKWEAQAASKKMKEISQEYESFNYKYFDHDAFHSIFVADDNVIVGPFFPGESSMATPAIHVDSSALLPQKYLHYFDQEWDKCHDPT